MIFLVIPTPNYTDHLITKAKEFGGNRAEVRLLREEEDILDPGVVSIFVVQGQRKEAEILSELRRSKGLPPVFIVEVPKPIPKTRVIKNRIRARIAHILSQGPMHGYQIYKKYKELFGDINLRLIYYHLERGLKEGIYEVVKMEDVEGEFSWGNRSRRKYYKLSI